MLVREDVGALEHGVRSICGNDRRLPQCFRKKGAHKSTLVAIISGPPCSSDINEFDAGILKRLLA